MPTHASTEIKGRGAHTVGLQTEPRSTNINDIPLVHPPDPRPYTPIHHAPMQHQETEEFFTGEVKDYRSEKALSPEVLIQPTLSNTDNLVVDNDERQIYMIL